jgi:hypothetical protein
MLLKYMRIVPGVNTKTPKARAKSCCRQRDSYASVIARNAFCDEAISDMQGIASLRPAKTTPDCARNDDVALRIRISGC